MPNNSEKITYDEITIEMDGKIHTANRTIVGTRKLYQTVEYKGITKNDTHPYKPDDTIYINSMARVLLKEIINELKRRNQNE